MSVAPSRKGWCPSLLSPMQSGDGWLVRVKPTAATMSASAARVIAESASRHGNGHIDLTSRANFQIRGLTPRSAEQLAESVIDQDLASANPSFEDIRNVMASPLGCGDDDTASLDAHALARDIEAMLGAEPTLRALPPKFGFLVDGGGILPLTSVTADIMVRAHGHGLALHPDGAALVALCAPSDRVHAVRALALAFLELSARRGERVTRMRSLVMDIGEEAIFAAAGLTSVRLPPATPTAASPIGFIPCPRRDTGVFGVGLPFGRIETVPLAKLAGLTEKFGGGTLRTTPWRALLIPSVAANHSAALAEAVGELGLITDAANPRRAILACVGAPACPSASVDTRAEARRLAAASAAHGLTLHVSGCTKGCAHAHPAALTLVGRDRRYDLVRDGRAGDRPTLTGLTIEQIIAELHIEQGSRA
ncbi:MAG: precorrin-3B synthase [Methyloceanibacter sp.]